jgi:phage tail tube protein FII
MSESISSASQTISTNLTCDKESMKTLKIVMLMLFLFVFICIMMSVFSTPKHMTIIYSNAEEFSNDELYSYKSLDSAAYSSIPLTAPNDKDGQPSNLTFGSANRYISLSPDGKAKFTIDVSANLYVLDGNIFGDDGQKVVQSYKAYLNKMPLGELKKDGDGLYKLKFETTIPKSELNALVEQTNFSIAYEKNGQSQVMVNGYF